MGKGTIKEIKNKKTTPHILNLDLFAKIKKPIWRVSFRNQIIDSVFFFSVYCAWNNPWLGIGAQL